ncbi:MAG: hypothetical protein WCY15_08465 [Phenylobacterium sp.]|jgi:hypothetical protein|uniref:hypothetical protein n=1 Tax=Phenylobacterium sp. TaxID=1871053 RepID=UPI002A3383B2|nr:hypothetical protein [Phenylobacterium sp.]MDD3838522.1 hypothetical protein [Phenylobacterium sp.]MDX9999606.1 hypothetical protein [Phenylobacterium sp.]
MNVENQNVYERGSSGARADDAAAAAPGDRRPDADLKQRQERLLDEGLEETFPASDPVAVVRLT